MKKGLIISRKSDLHSIQRFLQEAPALDLELQVLSPLEILNNPPAASDYDFVLPRFGTFMMEESFRALRLLEEKGFYCLNRSRDIAIVKDKWEFYQWCQREKLATPRTDRRAESFSFPLVQKPRYGSKGEDVFLIHNATELAARKADDILFQEFISTSAGQDTRVLMLRGQIIGHYLRRANAGEFRSNIAVGGKAESIPLPDTIREMALKAAAKLPGLGLVGFDFLTGPRGPLLLEANASPGFLGLENLGSTLVARQILESCLHKEG